MDDLDHSLHISDHDWIRFFEDSEECCLLQASLARPDSPGLSDGEDLDFTTYPETYLNEQAGEETKKPGVVGTSSVCSAEGESNVKQEPVGSDLKSEPELPVTEGVKRCAEKERWFVTVNDKISRHQELASGTVVKKKRKQKKLWKDEIKDGKDHACGNIDIAHGKVPRELLLDTNTNTMETDVNQTHLEVLCKGDSLNHLGNVESGLCANINQHKSQNSESIHEFPGGSPTIALSMDLAYLGVSYKDSTLHFAIENKSEPTKTKCMEMPDTMFIQEKDPDLGPGSSQTELTMDLTCTGDSNAEDNLGTNKSINSTDFELNIINQLNFGHIQEESRSKKVLKDLNMDVTYHEDSCKNKLEPSVTDNTKSGTIVDLDEASNSTVSGATHLKCLENDSENFKKDQRYFGASCEEDSFDLTCGTNAESPVDTGTDNPVSYTNTTESDEFADAESFSSSSYDSEAYHSAAESMEDPWRLSVQNPPCNQSISINDDSLADRGMHSCLQRDSNWPHIETSQIFPSVHPGADNMPNDNSMCSDGTKSTALGMSVDTPTSTENSSSSLGGQSQSLYQLDVTMESPEAYAKATGNNEPVYAISAFWDEMEKLTINDILHIRMGRCMLPVEEALNTDELVSTSFDFKSPTPVNPESAVLDTLDAADSDYCTNLDESKPDRSSCDFSTSDFEEEYWKFINSSQNSSPDLGDESYQSQCMDYDSTGEEESDETGTPVPSEDAAGQKWSCESTFVSYDVAVPHQMRKTKSMYDVHALKTMKDLSSQVFSDQSSGKSLEEPFNMSDGFEVVTPIMYQDEQYQISFPKVFENLFDDNKGKYEAMSVCVYGLQRNPALHINDYTFCTAINDMTFRNYSEEPIPIFSCSRPTVRELTFPKPGCMFLGTKYTAVKDMSPIQIISQPIVKSMDYRQTDRAFCFSQDLSSLYLVKNICFLEKRSDTCSCQSDEEEKTVDATDCCVAMVGARDVVSMTTQMFREAALRQISMENNQTISDCQSIFATIKQSDMCLVCIAFASWVLRSSDPEAADAWKAALLANVSALSAIQYLRHYMKKKASPQDD